MHEHATVGDSIPDVEALEDLLSEPTEALVAALRRIEGDFLILGVGGKMGPTLARMLRRATDPRRRVIGVSRFSEEAFRQRLDSWGVEAIRGDLMEPKAFAGLPDAANVVYMVAQKFGTTGRAPATWAANAAVPAFAATRFAGSRIVAFSTGNVYPLTPVASGGPRETDPVGPIGEYAWSALARERLFEFFAARHGSPTALIRLNYAVETRYGVLVDLARLVWEGRTVDLTMGYVNVIWQADAAAMALRALDHAAVPPAVFNVTGAETLSVRKVCETFAEWMDRPVRFAGEEAPDALLSNSALARQTLGSPRVTAEQVMRWVADWVMRGQEVFDRPTHFEARDGRF